MNSNAFVIRSDDIRIPGGSSDGYVVVADGRIAQIVGGADLPERYSGLPTTDCRGRTVMHGLCEHTAFFPGYLVQHSGIELSAARTAAEVHSLLSAGRQLEGGLIYGNSLRCPCAEDGALRVMLDREWPDTPVVLMAFSRYRCVMNAAAERELGFTAQSCWSESYWRLLRALVTQPDFESGYERFVRTLNGFGVTEIRDIFFDTGWGTPECVRALSSDKRLTADVGFLCQPNELSAEELLDEHGQSIFGQPDIVGVKLMVDDMAAFRAADTFRHPRGDIDYSALERAVLAYDRAGVHVGLHADGDRAVSLCCRILEKCVNMRRLRHSIISASLLRGRELEALAGLGAVLEIYPAWSGCTHEDVLPQPFSHRAVIEEYIGGENQSDYLNYRRIEVSGVHFCCGSDYPYMTPDVGRSLRCAVRGGEGVYLGMSAGALLDAWTTRILRDGTVRQELNVGDDADIALLSGIAESPKDICVEKTYYKGSVVFSA